MTPAVVTPPAVTSHRSLLEHLVSIPYWEDKIKAYERYSYDQSSGNWHLNGTVKPFPVANISVGPDAKVNYGCGNTILPGWINVDLFEFDNPDFRTVNLLEKHPFSDNSVSFGYSEDMMEHLTQAQSIFVLAEILRTLKPGGVMRFSFPGLEGVLNRHYSPPTEIRVRQGEFEAYSFWDHIHFYSKEEIALVARHLGYSSVEFVEYGISKHEPLKGRDTRAHQMDLNTYVELTK